MEMLTYLTLRTLTDLPSVNRGRTLAARERTGHDDADLLVFLFFCLCAMLAQRPRVRVELVGAACGILTDAWPDPSVPSADWRTRTTTALGELLAEAGGAPGEGRSVDDAPASVDPELCWVRVLMAEHGAAAMEQLRAESPGGPATDWLRRLAPGQEDVSGKGRTPTRGVNHAAR
jgi:hypothetical protein